MNGAALNNVEKAMIQVLMAQGIIEETKLQAIMASVAEELIPGNRLVINDTKEMFKRINSNIRQLALEIRSVVHRNQDSEGFTFYHGIANIDEDKVAIDFGCKYSTTEVQYISSVFEYILQKNVSSSNELYDIRPKTWKSSTEANAIILSLVEEKYLSRNDVGYFQIGIRAQLELRSLLEDILNKAHINEEDALRVAISKLPQIIQY